MNTIWWYIGVGTTIGGIQLVLGIAIGLWIRRSGARVKQSSQHDAKRAQEFAQELVTLTSTVSHNVNQHQARIDGIQDKLDSVDSSAGNSLTNLVVGVVGELMRANQDLQLQLSTAEVELQRQTSEIENHLSKSMTDELTGLPNRRAFENAINGQVNVWQRQRVPFTLMMLDIDHFKRVNDAHGHVAGDQVLRMIAEVVVKALRKPDLVTRYGGEEFAVLLPYTLLDDAVFAAKKVLGTIESAVTRFEEIELRVTASVGLASVMDGESAIDLLKRADAALYKSKGAGRNCGHTYNGRQFSRITFENTKLPQGDLPDNPSMDDTPNISPELEAICSELRGKATELADNMRQDATDNDALLQTR